MANCTSSPYSYNVQLFYSNQCFSCTDQCGDNVQSSACVQYKGPNLSCSGIETDDSVEVALQKIDEQICSAIGDYSNYQFNCLPDWYGEAITTEAEFVQAITEYACELNDTVTTFINTTFAAYETSMDARFEAIEVPGITCAAASVTSTDTLNQVLNKYCTAIGDLQDAISIAGVDWDQCLTVTSSPTTIAEAFSLLVDQMCQVYENTSGALPTFDNTGSCLTGGGATDSLSTTIGLIKTRLCQSPTWDADNVTWGCVTAPTDDQDIEEAIQNIVTSVNSTLQALPTFDESDFVVTANDEENPCAGVTISLATPINQDRFVAASSADTSPDTLKNKLTSDGSIDFGASTDNIVSVDIADKDYGDITVSGTGNTWTIDNDAVTFAKMQNVNTNVLLGRYSGGSGNVEEIAPGTGLSLSGGTLALSGKTLVGISVFTSNDTWTKPTNCNAVIVEVVGGGGGGGGVTGSGSNAAAAGGGGSGCYIKCYITSGLGSSQSVTIGSGGNGGTAGLNGSSGSATSFGSLVSCNGGGGGLAMTFGTSGTTAQGGTFGTLGSFSGVILKASQVSGEHGMRFSGTFCIAGTGGSAFSGGKDNTNTISSGDGSVGIGYGAGGNGGMSTNGTGYSGGNGNPGIVIVYEYS